MRPNAIIGLDLDNTLIDYTAAFAAGARSRGLVDEGFAGGKREVKALLLAQPDGDRKWQALQGHVYGAGIGAARLFDGVEGFFAMARRCGLRVVIISHKTEFGHFDPAKVNLRDAARGWLEAHRFFERQGFGVAPEDVFFDATREEKIARIAAMAPDAFVDDLPEVLTDPAFPAGVRRILFGGTQSHDGIETCRDWQAVTETVETFCAGVTAP